MRLARQGQATFWLSRILFFVIIGLVACATSKATLITGEGIHSMGQTFVDTASAYNQLHDQGIVSDDDYRDFRKFGLEFQATYRPLVNLYKAYATGEAQDQEKADRIAEMLTKLNQELLAYLLKTRSN